MHEFRIVDPQNPMRTLVIELDGKAYIPVQDQCGSICCLLDLDGNPKEWYDFGVFGNEKKGEDSLNPWRFAGKRKIGHLIYFGKRFYHPSLGRWLTPYPAGFEDGPNLYAYVHNNPLTHFDLLGLFDLDVRGKSYNECSNALDYHFQERFSEDHVGSAFMWGTVHYLAEICYNTTIFAFINPMQFSCPEFCKEQEESYQAGRYFGQGINYAATIGACAYSLGPAIANGASRFIGGMGKTLRFANFSKSPLKTFPKANILVQEVKIGTAAIERGASGAENINAGINLSKKLSQLETAQLKAVKTRVLPDGRIRYYGLERPSATIGPTRGRSYVTELDPLTKHVRTWMECYNHSGKVNRVHPKQINGQDLISPHYPPTARELGLKNHE